MGLFSPIIHIKVKNRLCSGKYFLFFLSRVYLLISFSLFSHGWPSDLVRTVDHLPFTRFEHIKITINETSSRCQPIKCTFQNWTMCHRALGARHLKKKIENIFRAKVQTDWNCKSFMECLHLLFVYEGFYIIYNI